MQKLPAAGHRAQIWKNGGGRTLELAVYPPDAGFDAFAWRASIATMDRDGDFSSFPGITRTLAILSGAGVELGGPGFGAVTLGPDAAPFTFDGGQPVAAHLLDGTTTDINLMCRDGRCRPAISRLAVTPTPLVLLPSGGTRLLLVGEDSVQVRQDRDVHELGPLDALLDAAGDGELELTAADKATVYILSILPPV